MFGDWDDPSDIDSYYENINGSIRVPNALSSLEFQSMHSQLSEPPKQEKSTFDVTPNSIFLDGHPVGEQPKINILRSADRENINNYRDGYQNNCAITSKAQYDWIHIFIIVMAFVVMSILYMNMRSQYCDTRQNVQLLLHMLCELQRRPEQKNE